MNTKSSVIKVVEVNGKLYDAVRYCDGPDNTCTNCAFNVGDPSNPDNLPRCPRDNLTLNLLCTSYDHEILFKDHANQTFTPSEIKWLVQTYYNAPGVTEEWIDKTLTEHRSKVEDEAIKLANLLAKLSEDEINLLKSRGLDV